MKQVIAVIDVGKTNKKLFLFDQDYKIVYERSARFIETVDEDGFPCENLESLRLSVFDSLRDVFSRKEFDVKALNFSTYGASFVYLDEAGQPLAPLYNYLKPYPEELTKKFYKSYGSEERFAGQTASPALGSLNSGLQLYRMKYEQPEVFEKIKHALHLPQYLSYLITNNACSDITSIGCHTALWDFRKNLYHRWVTREHVHSKLAPIMASNEVVKAAFPAGKYWVGIGLHDSSASLIPYLVNFHEPFVLISTGTWCISLNPFNNTPLTVEELKADCLCYLNYKGKPVKASRLFAGHVHEEEVRRIAAHFNVNTTVFRNMPFNPALATKLKETNTDIFAADEEVVVAPFTERDWSQYADHEEAYHQLMIDIIERQQQSTQLVLDGSPARRIFVDGGFSKNTLYMNLLAIAFPEIEIFAASMAQATALGAALAIHHSWNRKRIPNDIIELKYYAAAEAHV